MSNPIITIRLPRVTWELLYKQIRDLADATLADSEDEHDETIGQALDQIANEIGSALNAVK